MLEREAPVPAGTGATTATIDGVSLKLPVAQPGDLCVIEGAGAYCSSMSAKNYNSFPEAAEVLLRETGELVLIRQRQTLDQMLQNELPLAP